MCMDTQMPMQMSAHADMSVHIFVGTLAGMPDAYFIQTGLDGEDERGFKCKQIGRSDHPRRQSAFCDLRYGRLHSSMACLLSMRGFPGSAARPLAWSQIHL